MKKLLCLCLVGLCSVTLVACGENSSNSGMNEKKEIHSSEKKDKISNADLEKMYTTLADNYIDIINKMVAEDISGVDAASSTAIQESSDIKSKLESNNDDTSKAISILANNINEAATSVKNKNYDSISTMSAGIGSQFSTISSKYFNGRLPDSVKNMLEQDKQKQDLKNKTYGLGEAVEMDGVKVTLNSVEKTDERNQFSKVNPNAVIKLNFLIENNSGTNIYASSSNIQVYDSSNQKSKTYALENSIEELPTGKNAPVNAAFGIDSLGDIEITYKPTVSSKELITYKVHVE